MCIPTVLSLLTLGVHAQEGYCTCPVCLSVRYHLIALSTEPGPSGIPPGQVNELVSKPVQAAGNGSSSNGSSDTPARPLL